MVSWVLNLNTKLALKVSRLSTDDKEGVGRRFTSKNGVPKILKQLSQERLKYRVKFNGLVLVLV